jgi:predicted nucleotidyltransferase
VTENFNDESDIDLLIEIDTEDPIERGHENVTKTPTTLLR